MSSRGVVARRTRPMGDDSEVPAWVAPGAGATVDSAPEPGGVASFEFVQIPAAGAGDPIDDRWIGGPDRQDVTHPPGAALVLGGQRRERVTDYRGRHRNGRRSGRRRWRIVVGPAAGRPEHPPRQRERSHRQPTPVASAAITTRNQAVAGPRSAVFGVSRPASGWPETAGGGVSARPHDHHEHHEKQLRRATTPKVVALMADSRIRMPSPSPQHRPRVTGSSAQNGPVRWRTTPLRARCRHIASAGAMVTSISPSRGNGAELSAAGGLEGIMAALGHGRSSRSASYGSWDCQGPGQRLPINQGQSPRIDPLRGE